MHRCLGFIKDTYDWLVIHTTNEDEVTIGGLTSKNGSDFIISWGDNHVDTVYNNSNYYVTHNYQTTYTGNIRIRMVEGSIFEQLNSISFVKGHFDFNLNVFNDFDAFDSLTVNDSNDTMTISGDLSDVSNVSYYLYIGGNQITITYTTTTWEQIPSSLLYLRLATGHLTQAEVDQLLNDLAATGDAGSTTIDLRGNNAAPSSASASAITTLQTNGHTVLTN